VLDRDGAGRIDQIREPALGRTYDFRYTTGGLLASVHTPTGLSACLCKCLTV